MVQNLACSSYFNEQNKPSSITNSDTTISRITLLEKFVQSQSTITDNYITTLPFLREISLHPCI